MQVLTFDDSRTTHGMIRPTFDDAWIAARLAEDGQHGLAVTETFDPDLTITDINMPRLDGFGFIDAIRRRDAMRAVSILVLSTERADELKTRSRDAGATDWIVKPFNPKKLVRALRMVAG